MQPQNSVADVVVVVVVVAGLADVALLYEEKDWHENDGDADDAEAAVEEA